MSNGPRVKYIPPSDPVNEAGVLQIESKGETIELRVDSLTEDDRRAISIFAHHVEEEPRRLEYLKKYAGNYEMIRSEQRDDFDDWFLRQRRDRPRYAGIDDRDVRELRKHR